MENHDQVAYIGSCMAATTHADKDIITFTACTNPGISLRKHYLFVLPLKIQDNL